jgi:hypothetical protein
VAQNTCQEWERRVPWRSLTLDDLSPRVVARIQHENLLDQRLWETWREVRHQTNVVRPHPLGRRTGQGFLASEAQRLVSQILRRIRRRGIPFASMEEVPVGGLCPSPERARDRSTTYA